MCQEDQVVESSRRTRRKRALVNAGRAMLFVFGCVYFAFLIKVIAIGYLTWIGILVGVIYFAPGVISPIAGLAGRKQTEAVLTNVSIGMTLLLALVLAVIPVLPKRNTDGWRPYSFDAEIAALEAQRAVADEDNAALRYEAALASVDVNDRPDLGADGASLLGELSQQPWRAEDHPQVAAWLDSQAAVIDDLRQIGQMEQCRWPLYTGFGGEWPVPYKKLSYGTQLFTLAGNRHLGEGRLEDALETCFCLLRSADHMRQQTHDVDFRVAFSRERPALHMIRYILVRSELSSGDMDRIARRLPIAADTWNQDIARLLRFDEHRFAQFIAPVYEMNDQGQIRFTASFLLLSKDKQENHHFTRMARLWPLYYHLNMPLDPQGVWAIARQESARMRRFLEPGPVLRINSDDLNPFGPLFGFLARAASNWPRFTARMMCFNEFLYASLGKAYAAHLTRRRGTWLVLGLRRYRDEHGAWPASLDQVSEYVSGEAFLDPTSGERFVYVLNDDSFALYSTGINRLDEGSRRGYVKAVDRNEDDIAIWPPRVPKPPGPESMELMKKQLIEIYGEDYLRRKQEDANDV